MNMVRLPELQPLFNALAGRGYTLIGPTLRSGAIVYDEISRVEELPRGWTDNQEAGSYAVERRTDDALFGYVVGPFSCKRFLFPTRLKLFSARKNGKSFEVTEGGDGVAPKYAFIGVRPCDVSAIGVQDKVFAAEGYADPTYVRRREQAFIVAVNCTTPGGTCFCASMGTGPKAEKGFDIALTEILAGGEHYFLVETGSAKGEAVLTDVPHQAAGEAEAGLAREALTRAAESMGRMLDTQGLPRIIAENFENPHWDDVARRCMLCANCTMVCPTCFCSTVEDVTDLQGQNAERWRRWDSCFTMEFTKIAGGNVRPSRKARYRQWLSHKLSYWVDQFGTSGCVGCGRCITWCPVGIDITNEARTIRDTSVVTAPAT